LRKILLILFSVFVFLALGCSEASGPAGGGKTAARQGSPVFRSLSPQEASALIAKRKDLRVIDVRNPDELREGFIEGSTLIPFGMLIRGKHDLSPEEPLLLVCAIGGRSYAAGQILIRKGFREVYNLSGGMSAWKKAGLPVKY